MIECAAATRRPQDVVGLHFFNPAPVMKLVEVVHTVSTGADVVSTAQDLCRRLGKHPVTCGDRAGFIVNALLFPYLNDAVWLDVALAIQRELYLEFRERGFSPAPLLEQLVTAGYLGRKVGRGFRTYP